MIFGNFAYHFCGQHCCWTEKSIIGNNFLWRFPSPSSTLLPLSCTAAALASLASTISSRLWIKRRKWNFDCIKYGFFSCQEERNRDMSRLLNECLAILNIATRFVHKRRVIYKKCTRHWSEQALAIFQATARTFVQTVKFTPFISRNNGRSQGGQNGHLRPPGNWD